MTAPLAFASSSSSTLPSPSLPSPVPSSTRAFSSTPSTSESRARRKTRLVRKANLEKKVQLVRQTEQSRPDPVFGYAKGHESLWEKSLLKKILLDKEQVWGKVVKGEGEEAGEGRDKLYNFGLDRETAHQLSTVLPATAALRSTLGDGQTSVDSVMLNRFEKATVLEEQKKDTLMRIVDLRNADSKGIDVENTRRIVETFGRVPGDTASPEVQGAWIVARYLSLLVADVVSSSSQPLSSLPESIPSLPISPLNLATFKTDNRSDNSYRNEPRSSNISERSQ